MRFHVVALPHTQTTKEYSWCAYTEKVRNFCNMMSDRGHEVFLYASEESEARTTELITCIKKDEQVPGIPEFVAGNPQFELMNKRAIVEMQKRMQPKDFICLIGGLIQQPIAFAFPDNMSVEFGIGYGGVFSKYRVFESYAWMHTVYGHLYGTHTADGQFYDAVIPGYIDPVDFPFSRESDGYLLFAGRLIDRKGYSIAVDVAKHLNKRLLIAGAGEPPDYGEYLGVLSLPELAKVMGKADAMFVPTLYVGPMETVSIMAMATGTPIITTDWGCFAENNVDGLTGYRARTFGEFVWAAKNAPELDRELIHRYAVDNFSLSRVSELYQAYFDQLEGLWGKGWPELNDTGVSKYHRYSRKV